MLELRTMLEKLTLIERKKKEFAGELNGWF
jgi:hypothetical protein